MLEKESGYMAEKYMLMPELLRILPGSTRSGEGISLRLDAGRGDRMEENEEEEDISWSSSGEELMKTPDHKRRLLPIYSITRKEMEMRVIIVSATIQGFNGERYYICGPYFQKKGKRLHREVWTYHNGPIPSGFDIHHKDGDKTNNQFENLELKSRRKHHSDHAVTYDHSAWQASLHEGAAAWHGSDAGRQWHKEHYEKHCRPALAGNVDKICQQCGDVFTGKNTSTYCSRKCADLWRFNHDIGTDERTCPVCKQTFKAVRSSNKHFCSKSCAAKDNSLRAQCGSRAFRESSVGTSSGSGNLLEYMAGQESPVGSFRFADGGGMLFCLSGQGTASQELRVSGFPEG